MPDLSTSLSLCSLCPKLCSHVCPVYRASAKETLTPQAKMSSLLSLKQAGEEASPSQALPLYGCTGCGACTNVCLHKVEPAQQLVRGRMLAERADVAHPALVDLPERVFQRAQEASRAILRDPQLSTRLAKPGDIGLLPSCLPRRQHAEGPEVEARQLLSVLDRVREHRADLPSYGLLTVGSAGYALYAAGLEESFRLYAESLAQKVSELSMLVTTCSACTYLLKVVYPQHGVPLVPKVLHFGELILPYLAALPIAKKLPQATYHAPCHLSRRLKVDAPRQVLGRLSEQVDDIAGDEPLCCGAGGLLPQTDPDLAQQMAHEAMAQTTGQPIVSGCPTCSYHLSKSGHPTRDLLDVLCEAL